MDGAKLSEDEDDVANAEAWAQVIAHMLWLVPADRHARVLELATQYMAEAEAKRGKPQWAGTFMAGWQESAALRNWNTIMRLKSLVVQVFARDICNNHDPVTAAVILFCRHRYGHGSGRLLDYLNGLPEHDPGDGDDDVDTETP
jgi:hypothetical protein